MYISDTGNILIRKLDLSNHRVTILAGSGGIPEMIDGFGTYSKFYYPSHILVDRNHNIFVVDDSNKAIRRISSTGVVTTVVKDYYSITNFLLGLEPNTIIFDEFNVNSLYKYTYNNVSNIYKFIKFIYYILYHNNYYISCCYYYRN